MWRVTLVQVLLLVSMTAVALPFGTSMAWSFLCGGLVQTVPGGWFALRAFSARHHSAQAVLGAMYRGEAWRFLLTAVGFALVFALLRPLDAVAVFTGFATLWLVQLGGAFWLSGRNP